MVNIFLVTLQLLLVLGGTLVGFLLGATLGVHLLKYTEKEEIAPLIEEKLPKDLQSFVDSIKIYENNNVTVVLKNYDRVYDTNKLERSIKEFLQNIAAKHTLSFDQLVIILSKEYYDELCVLPMYINSKCKFHEVLLTS